MRAHISSCVIEVIRAAAKAAHPNEACGLLFGTFEAVTGCETVRNVARNRAVRFELDPAALFDALRTERAGGPHLSGYWHSHPSGDDLPSITDAAMAEPDGKLWLIVAGETVSAWRTGDAGLHGRFAQVALVLTD